MKNIITLKEIAGMAGVTPKTAERALRGVTLGVRKDARERAERVRRIAAEMAYKPSETAVNLRRGSTRTLGFLVNHLTDIFQAAAVETAMDEAQKAGYKINLKLALFEPERTMENLRELLASGADGILNLCPAGQFIPDLMTGVKKRKIPFLSVLQDTPAPLKKTAVFPDYSEAVKRAVKALAAAGHRTVLLSLFAGKDGMNQPCLTAFGSVCRKYRLTGKTQICADLQQVRKSVAKAPDGVILFGKYSLRTFHDECDKLHKKVDLIGFLNEWVLPSAAEIPLTGAIMDPAEEMIRQSVRRILAEIEGTDYALSPLAAAYVPAEKLSGLHFVNLTNQYLHPFRES